MRNLRNDDNFCLVTGRTGEAVGMMQWNLAFIANSITDQNIFYRGGGTALPLYLYADDNAQPTLDGRTERVPNLNSEIVERIADSIGLTFVAEKVEVSAAVPHRSAARLASPEDGQNDPARSEAEPPSEQGVGGKPDGQASLTALQSGKPQPADDTFAPIDILDYIYAVLHSPGYREKYKEFLKIDFPRVPYPRDAATFWQLAALGGELRQIHLLESLAVNKFITGFPVGGENTVEKVAFVTGAASILLASDEDASKMLAAPVGSVYFNDTQYFAGVPEIAWNFYIGGYQPAQKWLKDRKGRKLGYEDIQHYQKIIVALSETDRIMKEIDTIEIA